uniref:Uncharacterized protein n=1 Tax=Cacopsylla melanoneura TaxID=428564 RepID=A0A8D8LHP6_9HEMI
MIKRPTSDNVLKITIPLKNFIIKNDQVAILKLKKKKKFILFFFFLIIQKRLRICTRISSRVFRHCINKADQKQNKPEVPISDSCLNRTNKSFILLNPPILTDINHA